MKDIDYLILEYPVTRFITNVTPTQKALSPDFFSNDNTIRILLISSDTQPTIPGVEVEIENLRQILQAKPGVELKVLPTKQADLPNVEKQIVDWQPDIIHYAGHGSYDPESPEKSSLFFWAEKNKKGEPVELSAVKLKSLLRDSSVRFVYLSCCEGTTTGDKTDLVNDDFLGIADAVIHAGVPSVLGFRWPLSDKTGPMMAEKFYEVLLDKGSLPVALLKARQTLANYDKDDITWLSPMLIHQT